MLAPLILPIFTFGSVYASPIIDRHGLEYQTLQAQQAQLPLLKLPYGTWQASRHDAKNDVYTFSNIRFAAPPVGDLRWAKPAEPLNVTGVQDGKKGGTCYQSMPPAMISLALTGGLGDIATSGAASGLMNSLGSLVTALFSPATLASLVTNTQDLGKLMGGSASSEDCLFLDVVVPGKALRGEVKLPVVNWIYGGAYILGSKDGMYDGNPIVKSSNGSVIVVSANYRLGGFGFLAGTTVEEEGVPNAGFWDQRAALRWIQKHISLVGGDPNEVSVWGESAGGGSILHHLVAFGGTQPSLFKRAIIQSPGADSQFDRTGHLEKQFQDFASLAGCKGQGITCLRSKDTKTLKKASDQIVVSSPTGQYGWGPAVDGIFSRQLPGLELTQGNFAKDVESVIVTHVTDEASAFVPDVIATNTTYFNDAIIEQYSDTEVQKLIAARFPKSSDQPGRFKNEKDRYVNYIEGQKFTCHVRFIADAYKDKAYVGIYGRGSGKHGMDIKATFFDKDQAGPRDDASFAAFAQMYQNYLTSHAQTGDPNLKGPPSLTWPKVTPGPVFKNVLLADNTGYKLTEGKLTKEDDCKFWIDIWTKASGPNRPIVSKPQQSTVVS